MVKRSKFKYASPVVPLNICIPMELKKRLEKAIPKGQSTSEVITDILSDLLGVKVKKSEGQLLLCQNCTNSWYYSGSRNQEQRATCPACRSAIKIGYSVVRKAK